MVHGKFDGKRLNSRSLRAAMAIGAESGIPVTNLETGFLRCDGWPWAGRAGSIKREGIARQSHSNVVAMVLVICQLEVAE
jgi:hypothetical protein